jgi:hypothetical protein
MCVRDCAGEEAAAETFAQRRQPWRLLFQRRRRGPRATLVDVEEKYTYLEAFESEQRPGEAWILWSDGKIWGRGGIGLRREAIYQGMQST